MHYAPAIRCKVQTCLWSGGIPITQHLHPRVTHASLNSYRHSHSNFLCPCAFRKPLTSAKDSLQADGLYQAALPSHGCVGHWSRDRVASTSPPLSVSATFCFSALLCRHVIQTRCHPSQLPPRPNHRRMQPQLALRQQVPCAFLLTA